MIRKLNHAGMALFVFVSLSALILWKTGNLHFGPADGVRAGIEEAGDPRAHKGEEGTHKDDGEEHEGHGDEEAGTAHLEEIEQMTCEHGVRTIDCDNCRFEVGVVKLHPTLASALISTGTVEKRITGKTVRVTGEVQFDPTRVVEVPPLAAGRVTAIKAFLGQRVKAGDILATIHSSGFGEAKAAFLEAKAKLQLARASLDREEKVRHISPSADYLNAEQNLKAAEAHFAAAEKRLHLFGVDHVQVDAIVSQQDNGQFAELILRAPRNGTIVKQNISEGKVVDGTESLYTIADLSNVWVWCDVYERDFAALHSGLAGNGSLQASLRVAAFKDRSFQGKVDLIGSEIDEHTRTIKVRLQVESEEGRLRPGMFADVEIVIPSQGKQTVVPREAVLSDEGRHFVFQHWRENLWVRRDVKVGRKLGPYVEILGGVSKDAKIVTAGAFMLKSDVLRGKMGAGCAD